MPAIMPPADIPPFPTRPPAPPPELGKVPPLLTELPPVLVDVPPLFIAVPPALLRPPEPGSELPPVPAPAAAWSPPHAATSNAAPTPQSVPAIRINIGRPEEGVRQDSAAVQEK
jgi:hypothetical protein